MRGSWVLPRGETGGAWKTGVPRTKVLLMYLTICYYIAGLSANSQEVLSTCVNVYWIVNVILPASVLTLGRHSPGLREPNTPY